MKIDNQWCDKSNDYIAKGRMCQFCEFLYETEAKKEYCIDIPMNRHGDTDFYVEDIGFPNPKENIGLVNVIPISYRGKKLLTNDHDIIDKVWIMAYDDFQKLLNNSNEMMVFHKI